MLKKIFLSFNFYNSFKSILLLGVPFYLFSYFKKNNNFFFSFIPSYSNFSSLDIINIFFFNKLIIVSLIYILNIILIQLCFFLNISFYIYLFFVNIFLGILSEIFPLYNKIFLGCVIIFIFFFNLYIKINFFFIYFLFLLKIWIYNILNLIWVYLFNNKFLKENIFNLYKELSILIKKKYLFFNLNKKNIKYYLLAHKRIMDLLINSYEQLNILFLFKNKNKFLIKIFNIAFYLKENIFVNLYINKNKFNKLNIKKLKKFNKNIIILSNVVLNIGNNILNNNIFNINKYINKEIIIFQKNLYKYNNILNVCYLNNIINYLFYNYKYKFNNKNFFKNIKLIYKSKLIKYFFSYNINNYKNFLKFSLLFNFFFIFLKYFKIYKYYLILITIIYLNQINYLNLLFKILNRLIGFLIGTIISIFLIKIYFNRFYYLILILILMIFSYFLIKKNYFLSIIGFTIISFLNYKLLSLNILDFLYLRLFDIFIGYWISLVGNTLLWPQWNILILKKNIDFIFFIYKKIFYNDISNINIYKININKYKFLLNQIHNNIFSYYINLYNECFFNKFYIRNIKLLIINNYLIIENINSVLILLKFKYLNKDNILYLLNFFKNNIYINYKYFKIKKIFNIKYINIFLKKNKYKIFYKKILLYHLYKIYKHIIIMKNIYNILF